MSGICLSARHLALQRLQPIQPTVLGLPVVERGFRISCLRARSPVFAPASCLPSTAMICSSANLTRFIVLLKGRILTPGGAKTQWQVSVRSTHRRLLFGPQIMREFYSIPKARLRSGWSRIGHRRLIVSRSVRGSSARTARTPRRTKESAVSLPRSKADFTAGILRFSVPQAPWRRPRGCGTA